MLPKLIVDRGLYIVQPIPIGMQMMIVSGSAASRICSMDAMFRFGYGRSDRLDVLLLLLFFPSLSVSGLCIPSMLMFLGS